MKNMHKGLKIDGFLAKILYICVVYVLRNYTKLILYGLNIYLIFIHNMSKVNAILFSWFFFSFIFFT